MDTLSNFIPGDNYFDSTDIKCICLVMKKPCDWKMPKKLEKV